MGVGWGKLFIVFPVKLTSVLGNRLLEQAKSDPDGLTGHLLPGSPRVASMVVGEAGVANGRR